MTEELILAGLHQREGNELKNDPNDPQDPSKFGIGAPALGSWRRLGRRATLLEIEGLQWPEAEAIYRLRYIIAPGFIPANIPFEPLRVQLIDFGVNSGPQTAIRHLQRQLGVDDDGFIGPVTREAMLQVPPRLLNNALVASRLMLIEELTDRRTGYKRYEEGLEQRALLFFLARAT
jgi:lysozyme family protein